MLQKVHKEKKRKEKESKEKQKENKIKENLLNNPSAEKIFNYYVANNFGTISSYAAELICKSIDDYGVDWVEQALFIAVQKNARKWQYVNGILNSWSNKYGCDEKPWEIEKNEKSRKYNQSNRKKYDGSDVDWENE